MKLKLFLVIISLFSKAQTQVTGLSDWNIFIDPGHSQDENMGVNGYSEAKEVLKVGLHLKDILENQILFLLTPKGQWSIQNNHSPLRLFYRMENVRMLMHVLCCTTVQSFPCMILCWLSWHPQVYS